MTYGAVSPNVHVTGRRVVATIVDGFIFGLLNGVFSLFFGTHTHSSGFDFTRLSTGSGVLFVVVVLYYVLMEGLLGRTVGKMVTGIRVVDAATGNQPSIGQAALRTLLRLIDGILAYFVAFVVVFNSKNKRRLGDMAAKTLVVRA